jgi:DNA-binding transcriptional ArsR family regulator
MEMVELLHKEGELSVNEVAEKLGLSQPSTSRQLIILRDSGAVSVKRSQSRRLYQVSAEVADIVRAAGELTTA